jgi:hypothetical protein
MANRRNYSLNLPTAKYNWVGGAWVKVSGGTLATASRGASDYSRKKPRGKFLPPTNYSMTENIDRFANGSWLFYQGKRLQEGTNGDVTSRVSTNATVLAYLVANSDPNFSLTFPSNLADVAQAKAWSKLKSVNVNFGQAWAERKQTADLVATNIGRIIQGVRKIRRNPRVLADIVKRQKGQTGNTIVSSLPDWVIETVFGWKPLVSDIHGALSELDEKTAEHWKVTAIGKSKREAKFHGEYLPKNDLGAINYAAKCMLNVETLHGCKVRIDAVPDDDVLQRASSLGLTNPLSLAWELTPWSFAIDWLFPVGQYFDNLDAALGWRILGASKSSFTRHILTRSGLPSKVGNDTYQVGWSSRRKYVQLNRSTGVLMPWEIAPRFKDPFSSKQRVLTMLGLLGQIAGGGPVRHLH